MSVPTGLDSRAKLAAPHSSLPASQRHQRGCRAGLLHKCIMRDCQPPLGFDSSPPPHRLSPTANDFCPQVFIIFFILLFFFYWIMLFNAEQASLATACLSLSQQSDYFALLCFFFLPKYPNTNVSTLLYNSALSKQKQAQCIMSASY